MITIGAGQMGNKKIEVEYTVTHKQTIEWPDDEFNDFDYETLECNLEDDYGVIDDIKSVKVDGSDYEF